MDKNVSIVLSKENKNYRRLAQLHFGLSDEQMKGMHVHHNPPRAKGGRNVPEHLYIYSIGNHDYVHGGDGFVLAGVSSGWEFLNKEIHKDKNEKGKSRHAVRAGRQSVKTHKENGTLFFSSEFQSEMGKRGGTKARSLEVGIFDPEFRSSSEFIEARNEGLAKGRDTFIAVSSKKVKCLETNEEYPSTKEAQRANGGNVARSARSGGKLPANKLHWVYIEE